MYVFDDNFLSLNDKKQIEDIVISNNNFPYFLSNHSTVDDEVKLLYHTAVKRPEHRLKDEPVYNSMYAEYFLNYLNVFCKKHDIQIKEMVRCCVNLTFADKVRNGIIHKDEEKEHSVFLLYLDDREDCPTDLFDDNKKLIYSIPCKKFAGLYFKNLFHAQKYPIKGIRRVIVYTFIEK